jgi:hypothetical protein
MLTDAYLNVGAQKTLSRYGGVMATPFSPRPGINRIRSLQMAHILNFTKNSPTWHETNLPAA